MQERDIAGVRPRLDNVLELWPIDVGYDYFAVNNLSYHGKIPAAEFFENFAPDEKFNYRRDKNETPERMIRAYQLRDPKTGKKGPWLAGMTLDPGVIHEAWCHQRGYVCLIQEFGGRPIKAGESFSAAFVVGSGISARRSASSSSSTPTTAPRWPRPWTKRPSPPASRGPGAPAGR